METAFSKIDDGGRFIFCGQAFTKASPDKAFDSEGIDHSFDNSVLVEPIINPPTSKRENVKARLVPVRKVRGRNEPTKTPQQKQIMGAVG